MLNIVDEMCNVKQKGRRDVSGVTGALDFLDLGFKQVLTKKVLCANNDGAEVIVLATQKAKAHSPNLRYKFRHATHSTNCVGKNTEKHATNQN